MSLKREDYRKRLVDDTSGDEVDAILQFRNGCCCRNKIK